MVSWQDYIDNSIMPTGTMYASILSHAGEKWASSPNFEVGVHEVQALHQALTDKSSFDKIAGTGFTIAGQSYTFLRGEVDDEEGGPSFCQGRCKDEGITSQGAVVYCTNLAIVIGIHDPNYSTASFNAVNSGIGQVVDYMMESGL